jgi:DNA-binding response OmpR family regulator
MLILIAEDDRPLASFITALLEENDYRVVRVYDGPSVLCAITQEPPDLILLDVMLPEIDGFTLCRTIRRTSDLPISFLSARSEIEDRVAGCH